MLTGVDPPLDGAVILLEHVVQIWHRPMPAILGESAFGFELPDGGRIRGVAVGVDHPRRGMVLLSQCFGQEALCCGRVLLGRETIDDPWKASREPAKSKARLRKGTVKTRRTDR